MILISHRGNLNGRVEDLENTPEYIDLALSKGFDVEIDTWFVDGKIYLGHDSPDVEISESFLIQRKDKLWVHCKNVDMVSFLNLEKKVLFNYFWHENDTLTLTSKGYIWAYPGKQPIKNSVAVLPEINQDLIMGCIGVCSDFIFKYMMYK